MQVSSSFREMFLEGLLNLAQADVAGGSSGEKTRQ